VRPTVVYVHGNGNKIRKELLKAEWDAALFGEDMGVASRMVYWAGLRYATPLPDSEFDEAELVRGSPLEGTGPITVDPADLLAQTLAEARAGDVTAPGLEAETSEPDAGALDGWLQEMAHVADAVAEGEDQAAATPGLEVLPLPRPARVAIFRELVKLTFKDVYAYFFGGFKEPMRACLRAELTSVAGPLVVISHSLGTIIAYDEVTVPGGTVKGTAFLVRSAVCFTNYHVPKHVIKGAVAPSKAVVRFDYKRSQDGVVLSDGTEHRLPDSDWLVDANPPSTVDVLVDPGGQLPEDQFDYAVFRLTGEPSEESIGGSSGGPQAPKRGWTDSAAAEPFSAESTMFILQHPAGEPLKLAFGPVSGLNGNSTRVRHKVNTEPGSSGSPCFNRNLELAALHHGGDPNFAVGQRPQYNEAMPLSAGCRLLAERNLASSVFAARS
jgi:Trypsin-like peptidase domain